MKTLSLIIITTLFSLTASMAQTKAPCACCTENHSAFDFWEGDWTVYSPGGNIIGTNNIVKMEDNCVLQENWVASGGVTTGTSYNFFDLSDSTWNQVWISNTGNILRLKGNINENGAMVMKSHLVSGPNGKFYNKITWTKNKDGSVTQIWEILNQKNESISQAFEGIYKKKPTTK